MLGAERMAADEEASLILKLERPAQGAGPGWGTTKPGSDDE